MPITPYELTTISGDDLTAVRRSFAQVTGTLTVPNLAALAGMDVPEEVKEITILGAVKSSPWLASVKMPERTTAIALEVNWQRQSLHNSCKQGGFQFELVATVPLQL